MHKVEGPKKLKADAEIDTCLLKSLMTADRTTKRDLRLLTNQNYNLFHLGDYHDPKIRILAE
jgi:hypothetical protein